MRIRIPRKKVRERFLLIYELEGCQKATDFLTEYYGIRRMKIVLNGRKVGNGDSACYFGISTARALTSRCLSMFKTSFASSSAI
jgi:hypothetical protein